MAELTPDHKAKLAGIIQRMEAANEPAENIRSVVSRYKERFGTVAVNPAAGALVGAIATAQKVIPSKAQKKSQFVTDSRGYLVPDAQTQAAIAKRPKPKRDPLAAVKKVDEWTANVSKAISALNIGTLAPTSPQNLPFIGQFMPKPADLVAGAVTWAPGVAADVYTAADPEAETRDRLGALANTIINTGLPELAAFKGSKIAYRAVKKAFDAKNPKAMVQALEQAEKQGLKGESLVRGQKTEPAPVKLPKTQPTPSGVSAKAKREVKPVVKPVEEARTVDEDGFTRVGDYVEVYHGTSARRANKIKAEGFRKKAVKTQTMGADPPENRESLWFAKTPGQAKMYAEMHQNPTVVTVRIPKAEWDRLNKDGLWRNSGPVSWWTKEELPAQYVYDPKAPPTPPKATPESSKGAPLESIGGPPREIPLSKPTGEIPNPKKVAEAPKVEPKVDVPETPSGLSRSSRAVLADVYGTNKPTSIGGKSLDDLYESGRKKLNEGFDAEAEMDALAKAGRPATDEEIGAFSVYRDDLIGQLDLLERKLKGGSDDVVSERLDLLEKVAAFDRNLDEVKAAGGRSLNALKIGHKVAWDNLNEVLIEAKRYKPVSAGREAQFRELTGKQAEQAERITRLEKEVADLRAGGVVEKAKRGPRFSKEELDKELDDLFKQGKEALGKASAGLDPELFTIAGKIAVNYAKRGVNTLDEVVEAVQAAWRENFGQEIDRQDVIDAMAAPAKKGTPTAEQMTRREIQAEVTRLRSQAKRESTANRQKILKDAADLQKQLETGNYRVPTKREKVITKELEDARAERSLYAAKVQAALRAHAAPMGKKVVKEVAGAIRGTILGSDIGVLTRQGLFGLSRPGAFVKGVGKGLKALASEKNLVKIESDILSHKVGGQTAGVVYRKAGLSLSSHLTNPEEMVIGRLLSRIPGVGSLGRFQTAFINTLRSETMDRAIKLGYKENELAARANFINSATGRSNAKNVPTALEVIMTSPRYERSRWEMLAQPFKNPALIVKDAVTGKGLNRGAVDNIQDMAITAAEIYGLYKLTEASGYEVDWDPTSSDFLKMRKGDEVWDPSAGLAPRIRDAMRFVAWGMNPTYQHNVSKVVSQTVLRPVSPAIKQPVELGSQQVQRARGVPEDKMASFFTGWKIDEDEKGWITFAPLIIQTAKKYLDEGDREGAASAAFREWIGQSVNKYPKPNPKK